MLVKSALTASQKRFLSTLDLDHIYVIGGTAAVSEHVFTELKEYGSVERVYGADRQATSLAIAKKFFPDSDTVVFAYSSNFPDGLCGGVLASRVNAPILLGQTGKLNKYRNYVTANNANNGYVLGGEGLIDDDTITSLYKDMTPPHIVAE